MVEDSLDYKQSLYLRLVGKHLLNYLIQNRKEKYQPEIMFSAEKVLHI